MTMTADQLCIELLQKLETQKDLECIHLTNEMAMVFCEGYQILKRENNRLRGTILEHLPTFAEAERKKWEEERRGN